MSGKQNFIFFLLLGLFLVHGFATGMFQTLWDGIFTPPDFKTIYPNVGSGSGLYHIAKNGVCPAGMKYTGSGYCYYPGPNPCYYKGTGRKCIT